MPCTKQTTKKYSSRNSPPYPANECKVGSSKKGNDGLMYTVSSPNKNGVKRWLKKPTGKVIKKKPSQNGLIKRRSDYDDVLVTFKPYHKKPSSENFIFFIENEPGAILGDFRSPDAFGTSLVYGKNAKAMIKDGFKVWVVKNLPKGYR